MTLIDVETGEVVTLADLEDIIGQGLQTFVDVGAALSTIRDAKLYLEYAETFEGYCRERWGLSRSRAYELMDAASIAQLMSGIPDTPTPGNAGQATALRPLKGDPEAMAAAMTAATEAAEAEGRTATAADVKAAVADQIEPDEQPPAPVQAQQEAPAPPAGPTPSSPKIPKSGHERAVGAVVAADKALERFLSTHPAEFETFTDTEWEVVQFLVRRAGEVAGRVAEAGRRRRRATTGGK